MGAILMLPQRLDALAAQRLLADLLERRGQPLSLDASSVETISALALEVVVSAGLQWQCDQKPICIVAVSEGYQSACGTLGLNAYQPWLSAVEQPSGV
jgi:anti-anti-sigma regulatory factor